MFHRLPSRPTHYALLLTTWAVLCLPNLGVPSLWEIDESHNTEAAQEMYESGNPIVPTFNYELRDDKPALLYWLQMAAFRLCGVNEFAARLPSALAALLSLLTVYELGRRMFGAAVGLLAGVILASSVGFCAAAHFANPDALLTLFTLLSLACFFRDHQRRGRFRYVGGSLACGLAVLAKGPVGLVLPLAVVILFLLWQRQLRRLWDLAVVNGVLAFLLTAMPWYVWVALETKGQWLYRFWNKHHVGRYTGVMENHGGPFFTYLLVLLVGVAPWSIYLGLAAWRSLRKTQARSASEGTTPGTTALPWPWPHLSEEVRYLVCWIAVYFVFFSLAATKLPNYILPLYPAVAILTARFLDDWRRGLVRPAPWLMTTGLVCLALIGVAVAGGVLIVGGVWSAGFMRGRILPGLERLAPLALVPLAGALAAYWCLRRQRRNGMVACVAVSAVLFLAALAGWGAPAVSRYRAPRQLAQALPADQLSRDVRIGAYVCPADPYFQPSLVFYCRREVKKLAAEKMALEFLNGPLPSYLFLKATAWEGLCPQAPGHCRLLGRCWDLYENKQIVLIANEAACQHPVVTGSRERVPETAE